MNFGSLYMYNLISIIIQTNNLVDYTFLKVHHFHFEGPTLHRFTSYFTHRRCDIHIIVAINILIFFREVFEPIVIVIKLKIKKFTMLNIY